MPWYAWIAIAGILVLLTIAVVEIVFGKKPEERKLEVKLNEDDSIISKQKQNN